MPYSNPNNYVKVSGGLAAQLSKTEKNGAIWANQFDNVANRQGHIETTGQEIWQQTDGKVDGFVGAVGTGGTLAGVAMALKEHSNAVRIAVADPMGAALYSYYTTGTLKSEGPRSRRYRPGPHHQELRRRADRHRLPDSRCRGGTDHFRPARARRPMPRRLIGHQHCRIRSPRQGARSRPHDRDGARRLGTRYQSKLFNPQYCARKTFPVPPWLERRPSI